MLFQCSHRDFHYFCRVLETFLSFMCSHQGYMKRAWTLSQINLTFSLVTQATTILQNSTWIFFQHDFFCVFSSMREFRTTFSKTSETDFESMGCHQSNSHRGSNSDGDELFVIICISNVHMLGFLCFMRCISSGKAVNERQRRCHLLQRVAVLLQDEGYIHGIALQQLFAAANPCTSQLLRGFRVGNVLASVQIARRPV